MSTIRCKVDLGTDAAVEVPGIVPLIYRSGRRGPLSGRLRYATLERIGSEVWATFELPGDRTPGRVTATASLVIPLHRQQVERFFDRLWITAIIVRALPLGGVGI